MPLFKVNDRIIHFVHIPKTGGTSIEKWFSEKYPSLLLNGKLEGVPSTLQHLDAKQYTKLFGDWPDFEFTVVRNPYDRLISAYRWRYSRAAKAGSYVPPFKLWLLFKMRVSLRDPRIDDNFYLPQVEFLRDKTLVYKFENGLDAVMGDFRERLSLRDDRPLPHFYKTGKLPIILDEECVELIRTRYIEDFSGLGYSEGFSGAKASACEVVSRVDTRKMIVMEFGKGLPKSAVEYFFNRFRLDGYKKT